MGGANKKMLFCRSCEDRTIEGTSTWQIYFLNECKELRLQCTWAKEIPEQMQRHRMKPQALANHKGDIFIHMTQQDYSRNISYQKSQFNSLKLYTDSSQQSQISNGLNDEDTSKKSDEKIRRIIRESQLTEEQVNEALQNIQENQREFHVLSSFHSDGASGSSFTYQDQLMCRKGIYDEDIKDPKQKLLCQLTQFQQMTKQLEQHLKDSDNQLGQLLRYFVECFVKTYRETSQGQSDQAIYDIQQFSRVLHQTAIIYYDLNKQRKDCKRNYFLTDENILCFYITQIMSNPTVYQLTFEHLMVSQKVQYELMKQQLAEQESVTTTECEIQEPYRLDISTFYLIKSKNPTLVKSYEPIKPYKDSIQCLTLITKKFSPASKLKIMLKSQELILKSIRSFYRNYGVTFDELLGADQIFPIQIYIIIKAQIHDIDFHLAIIEKLSTNKILQGTSGYYLMSFKAACDYVREKKLK